LNDGSSRVPKTRSLHTRLDSRTRSGSYNASAGRGSAGSLVTACPRQTSPGHGDLGFASQPGISEITDIPLRSARCPCQLPKFATLISCSGQAKRRRTDSHLPRLESLRKPQARGHAQLSKLKVIKDHTNLPKIPRTTVNRLRVTQQRLSESSGEFDKSEIMKFEMR
jgi:hypothetical protein